MEVFCLASGPSLTAADVELVRQWRTGNRKVYVTNNTHTLAPWADLLFAGDAKWIEYYGAEGFQGERVTASSSAKAFGWDRIPNDVLWYENSGAAIISLAMYRGAKRIFLLGYDCQKTGGKTHWHGSHVGMLSDGRKLHDATNMNEWSGKFGLIATSAKERGVQIVNCTRETALKCYKRLSLETCISTGQIDGS